MKKLLLLACIICYTFNLNAQCDSTLPISENFSDATAIEFCWDFIDSDGDGYGWHIVNLDGNPGLVSESYTGATGSLTPDNWVITNAIDLTSYNTSSNVKLDWKVRTPDWSFDQERYTVYVATGNKISDFLESPMSVFENLDNSDAAGLSYANRSLDISSLAGNIVYVAFRHWASVFQNQINIDDVAISASGSNGGCTSDADGDGVCDANDQCPGFDDTIDTNGNGIPDGCESSCTEYTANFINNPLTHSGSGSGTTTLSFPTNSQNVSFTISGISQKLKGKRGSEYIEGVTVSYNGGLTYGTTYTGANVSSVDVSISGSVQSVTVSLKDLYDGNSGSNMSINFSSVTYCSSSTPCNDADGDGVCDADDQCPGFDDTIDTNGNGIPDGCESTGCVEYTNNFANNPLTHSGSSSNTTTLTFPSNSQDVSFSISGISQKLKGKTSNKYIEGITVSYNGGITYGTTYSGANVSSVDVFIPGSVQSVSVSLTDILNGNTSSNMTINFSAVTYCINSSQARNSGETTTGTNEVSNEFNERLGETIRVYPNPASQKLFVKYTNLNTINANISFYDITGNLVRNVNLNEQHNQAQEIDLNGLSTGLYLMRMVSQNGDVLKVERIIIK